MGEAQTLLPVLDALLRRAQGAGLKAGVLDAEYEALRQRIFVAGGLRVDIEAVLRGRREQTAAIEEAKSIVSEIEEIGAAVHDLSEGLLDLPYRTDSGEVLLCWKLGEPTVGHWHRADEEPIERRPIDDGFGESFGRSERERLN